MTKDDLNIALGAVQEIQQELGRDVIDHGFIKDAAVEAEAKIEAALAALEAEPLDTVLAVVEARCFNNDYSLNGLHYDLDACVLYHEGGCGPVTVTITARTPDE